MLYLGIDISKNKLDSCLLFDEGRRKRTKIVANSRVGCTELLAWLKRDWPDVPLPQVHVVMEGTGIYHEVAACALHDAGLKVSVINPAHARDFAKALGVHSKTDAIDSQVLALFAQRMIPAAWQRPAEPVRQLQAMLSRRQALQKNLLRERNRQEKALAAGTTQLVQQSLQRSIAWPAVWPRLSVLRMPVSVSSASTIRALKATHCATISSRFAHTSPDSKRENRVSSSRMPVLIASAAPFANSSGESVAKVSVSHSTSDG